MPSIANVHSGFYNCSAPGYAILMYTVDDPLLWFKIFSAVLQGSRYTVQAITLCDCLRSILGCCDLERKGRLLAKCEIQ